MAESLTKISDLHSRPSVLIPLQTDVNDWINLHATNSLSELKLDNDVLLRSVKYCQNICVEGYGLFDQRLITAMGRFGSFLNR